jgi:hypothetical protein
MLGGGLVVGSVAVVLEDAPSRLYRALLRLFAGEGFAQGHFLCRVAADDGAAFCGAIPLDVSASRDRDAERRAARAQAEKHRQELKIAWRYQSLVEGPTDSAAAPPPPPPPPLPPDEPVGEARESGSLAALRAGGGGGGGSSGPKLYCHSLAMHRSVDAAALRTNPPLCVALPLDECEDAAPSQLAGALRRVEAALEAQGSRRVTRIIIESLGAGATAAWAQPGAPGGPLSIAAFMRRLRVLARRHAAVALVSVPPQLAPPSALCEALHAADLVLRAQSLAGAGAAAADFPGFHGLLAVERAPRMHAAAAAGGADLECYVARLDAKSLHLERLSLPPEGSRSEQGAAPAAASLVCAPGPAGAPSAVDF